MSQNSWQVVLRHGFIDLVQYGCLITTGVSRIGGLPLPKCCLVQTLCRQGGLTGQHLGQTVVWWSQARFLGMGLIGLNPKPSFV